jgi:hypothetical protein
LIVLILTDAYSIAMLPLLIWAYFHGPVTITKDFVVVCDRALLDFWGGLLALCVALAWISLLSVGIKTAFRKWRLAPGT